MLYPVSIRKVQANPRHRGVGQDPSQQVLTLAASQDPAVAEALRKAQAAQQTQEAEAKKASREMEEGIKKEAIKSAVYQAGLQLALMAIPIVGQTVSALAGAVLGESMKRYVEELKAYIKKKTAELEAYVAKRQAEYEEALTFSYTVAYRESVPLALSWQPLKIEATTIKDVLNTEYLGIGGVIDSITGKNVYEEGKQQINAMVAKGKRQIDEVVLPIIRKVKEPAFIALLAKQTAIAMRNRPDFMQIARSVGVPPPSKYLGQQPTAMTTGYRPLPHTQTFDIGSGGAASLPSTQARPIASTGQRIHWQQPSAPAPGSLPWWLLPAAGAGVLLLVLTR